MQMKNGTEFLLTDTVGFIQKLPTMLVHIHTAYSSCLHVMLLKNKTANIESFSYLYDVNFAYIVY
jgi:GTP-binding protein HflX